MRNEKRLLAAQRQALIKTTKALCHDLRLLSPDSYGRVPSRLVLGQESAQIQGEQEAAYCHSTGRDDRGNVQRPGGREEAQRLTDEQLVEEWQQRWDSSER